MVSKMIDTYVNHKTVMPKTAQQSVHPTCGSLRGFRSSFLASAEFFLLSSESTPAHTRVTQTVGQALAKENIIEHKGIVIMNNRSKILSVTHFILALTLLFTSLSSLSSALTYDRRQSFAPPTLIYDTEKNQQITMNMETPLLVLFTVLFGLGWWCEGLSETLFLKNNRKTAIAIFYIPVTVLLLSFIGMTQVPHGFIEYALKACGSVTLSGFYLRYSQISPEAAAKLAGRN